MMGLGRLTSLSLYVSAPAATGGGNQPEKPGGGAAKKSQADIFKDFEATLDANVCTVVVTIDRHPINSWRVHELIPNTCFSPRINVAAKKGGLRTQFAL
jgi:hypothetical protein